MGLYLRILLEVAWTAPAIRLAADTVAIRETLILTAPLPLSTTWQVETSTNGGTTWTPTGILAAGAVANTSVRLDGLPVTSLYRFAAVGASGTVTPTLSRGYHLTGSAAANRQVPIQSSLNLTAWTAYGAAFTGTSGTWLRVVRPPLLNRRFFRAEVPASPITTASVTSYTPGSDDAAGFGPVADDMPAVYRNGFLASMAPQDYHRGGMNAASAGECYEISGPGGSTTVIVSDLTPDPPAGTVDAGRGYFDLATNSFSAATGMSSGSATVAMRLVPAPVTGNLKLYVPSSSDGYYLELRPYNHRAGVSTVEIRSNGATNWITLPRSTYNSFIFSGNGGLTRITFPMDVRVTSRFGEAITIPAVAAVTTGSRITAASQFTVFPDLAPAPAWRVEPVYTDSFGSVPGDFWTPGGYGGASVNAADATTPYDGSASARIDGLAAFAGVVFSHYPLFPKPEYGELRCAFRSGTSTAVSGMAIQVSGYDSTGLALSSSVVKLPSFANSWQIFRIPLDAAATPARIASFTLINQTASTQPPVLMDAISLPGY